MSDCRDLPWAVVRTWANWDTVKHETVARFQREADAQQVRDMLDARDRSQYLFTTHTYIVEKVA